MKLIMVSHNYHPFLLNEIKFASEVFEEVFVIALENKEVCMKYENNSKVKLCMFSKAELHRVALRSSFQIFDKEKRDELLQVIKTNRISKKYIKEYLLYLAMENICIEWCKKINVNGENSRHYVALACWYASDAYAIYQLKKKYRELSIFSLAHSFEIDPVKNPYIVDLFRKQYHEHLKCVYFISKNVMREFNNSIGKLLNLSCDNVKVRYLGTLKKQPGYTKRNEQLPYHILTCSYVVPVKRVSEFYNVLNKYADIPLIWTHIGEGKGFMDLSRETEKKDNQYLKVNLLGKMTNDDIHKFYIENNIDLFVNYSTSEGIPVSIMEAIAYGVPVVATDVGGNSEIVNDSYGAIVPVDVKGIVLWKTIKGLLQKDKDELIEMKKMASAFFNCNFNADSIRVSFYQEILRICEEES